MMTLRDGFMYANKNDGTRETARPEDWSSQQYFALKTPRRKLKLRMFEEAQDGGGWRRQGERGRTSGADEAQLADGQATCTTACSAGTNAQGCSYRLRKRTSAFIASVILASSLVFLLTNDSPGAASTSAGNILLSYVPIHQRVLRFVRTLCADTEFTHDDASFRTWTDIYNGITANLNYWDANARVDPGYGKGSYSLRENDVAFVLPILDCPELHPDLLPGRPQHQPTGEFFLDNVAALSYSVCEECNTVSFGGNTYNATLVAIIAGDAIECIGPDGLPYDRVRVLEELGFFVKIVGSPILEEEITDDYLRENVQNDVGVKDLLRLQAFTLTSHPLVVLLDFDSFILQPLDDIFQSMAASSSTIAYSKTYSPASELATGYNNGADMGCIIIKPSLTELNSILTLYKTATYDPVLGWDSSGVGSFPGAMGSSGILSYYYGAYRESRVGIVAPMLLDECLYSDSASDDIYGHLDPNGNCRNGQSTCNDCSTQPTDGIVVARLGCAECGSFDEVCGGMPYDCPSLDALDQVSGRRGGFCRHIHQQWFEKRKAFEEKHFKNTPGGPKAKADGTFDAAVTQGYCKQQGQQGYEKIIPDDPTGSEPEVAPSVAGRLLSCSIRCPQDQYLKADCTCTTDECQACPKGTTCQRSDATHGPLCIDCECGFCDYASNACCAYNGNGNCKPASNRNECLLQNAHFPASTGSGHVCTSKVSALYLPSGCGCQPTNTNPCTYGRTLQGGDKCFVLRAGDFTPEASLSGHKASVAANCKACLDACAGSACLNSAQFIEFPKKKNWSSTNSVQHCLGSKMEDNCRASCAAQCEH